MASKALATTAFLLSLNLLFFTLVSSTKCPPPPAKSPEHSPPPAKSPEHSPPPSKSPEHSPPPSKSPEHSPPPAKSPEHSSPPAKSPEHSPPPPASPSSGKCPIDTLKLGVCATLLDGLLHIVVGTPPKTPCCPLINGLADLEAAVCLCTALKANILGININVPTSLSLLLNYCGKGVPAGFQCP